MEICTSGPGEADFERLADKLALVITVTELLRRFLGMRASSINAHKERKAPDEGERSGTTLYPKCNVSRITVTNFCQC
jgi:hypothetical protein